MTMGMNTNNSVSGSEPKKMPKKLSNEELKLMAESGYSKKAIDLYVNKVNMGPLENASVITTFLGQCGDLIRLYLQISNRDKIENASFYYLGCPGSAASASAMTTLLKGMTVKQAKQLVENDIVKELGGLPKSKNDCATLSIKTLRKAIAEYEKQKGRSEI